MAVWFILKYPVSSMSRWVRVKKNRSSANYWVAYKPTWL